MREGAVTVALMLAALGCDDHTSGAATATVEEVEAPTELAARASEEDALEVLTIDTARSSVGFVGAKVTDSHEGRFDEWSGTVRLEPGSVPNSSVEITIRMASVQIEPERLLTHLKSDDFFGVERFPEARFESTRIAEAPSPRQGDETHLVSGRLTLHGQTRTITFPARIEVGANEVRARARFTIDRQQFGITYPGMPDDLIRDDVVIQFDVRAPRGR